MEGPAKGSSRRGERALWVMDFAGELTIQMVRQLSGAVFLTSSNKHVGKNAQDAVGELVDEKRDGYR